MLSPKEPYIFVSKEKELFETMKKAISHYTDQEISFCYVEEPLLLEISGLLGI